MTNIETIIDFFEFLNREGVHPLTSDPEHFAKIEEIFRLAKEGQEFNRNTLYQLLDHYRAAEETLSIQKGKPYVDDRWVLSKLEDVRSKGKTVSREQLYDTVRDAVQYGNLLLTL